MNTLTNEQKSIYALLADNAYWDIRHGFIGDKTKDFSNSNWTPIPSDWKVLDEYSNSGKDFPNLNGFSARAYQNIQTKEIVIAFANRQAA